MHETGRAGAVSLRARGGGRAGQKRGGTAAVGYLRRSTDRQEQSIPDQRRAIERFAAERGLRILDWYTDDAVSGTSSVSRKAFQRLIADAQAPGRGWSTILVYDVKRFGRVDNDEAGYYRHLLRQAGVEVLYATEGFSGAETDDLLRPVKQWQARQESKDLSKVTIRGLLSKAEGGWWMGGVPPHGYDLAYQSDRGEHLFTLRHMPDGTKLVLDATGGVVRTLARGESMGVSKRDRARLVPGDPARVEAVRTIFRLYVEEGRGFTAVADHLNRTGVPAPRGAAWSRIYSDGWRSSTVRAILVNPLYAGDMVWNRRTDARFHSIVEGRAVERTHPHGARLVPNDRADWMIVRDTHQGLVDRGLFERAQAAMASRGNGGGAHRGGDDDADDAGGGAEGGRPVGGWTGARARFLLSGLVRCGRCDGRYQGVTRTKGKRRKDGSRVRTYSYACGSYIARGKSACEYGPVGQETLEGAVIAAVLEHYGRYRGEEGLALLTAEVRAAMGLEAEDLREARKRLAAERKAVETRIANLLDSVTPGTRDLVEERLTALQRERTLLEARGQELELLASRQAAVQDQVRELARFVEGLEFTLRHGTNTEKVAALRRCVEGVTVNKEASQAGLILRGLTGGEPVLELAIPFAPMLLTG